MGLKVATTCVHWSQPFVPHSPSSSQTLATGITSPSKRRGKGNRAIICRYVHGIRRSAFLGVDSAKLHKARYCEKQPKSRVQNLRRSCSACLDAASDEEFSKKIQELAHRFQSLADGDNESTKAAIVEAESELSAVFDDIQFPDNLTNTVNFIEKYKSFPNSKLEPFEPPDWSIGEEIIPSCIERKANSVELPLSLRIIKRKKQWDEGFREAGESAYCSMKKAFSSMVFIIQELHSYTIQMREMLYYEDLQGIMVRVQREIHASFVWLFERVFSHTPTLMVYVMILLANYSVHSMSSNSALAAVPLPQTYAATTESVAMVEDHSNTKQPKFDSSAIKTFIVSSSNGKTTSIGGNNGGGGKYRPIASGTDGDGRSDGAVSFDYHRTIDPDGASSIGNPSRTSEESVSDHVIREEESSVWNSIVEEASSMLPLDHETMQMLVSPVDAKIETDEYEDYFRTDLLYRTALSQEPNNPLLLANYAQFLYLVTQEYDRAEEYFKKAVDVEPKDAEAFSKYASFLWQVKKDLWAAEETYLEAISADPSNSCYAANYAHFLWSTGGEDTCFPLSSPDTNVDDI